MMKLFTLFLCFSIFTGFAQTDCKPYAPLTEGTTWELTHYSDKDKVTGRTVYELLKFTDLGDSLVFRIKSTSFDDKDEEIYVSEFDASCIGGVFELDMKSKIDGATMANYQSMDVKIDASNFPIPPVDKAVGTALGDGTLDVQVSMNGMNTFKMTVEVTDRVVAAHETLETTAGKFECVKITQTINTKMIVKMQNTSIEWYSEEVGMVRSESYDKKGRLSGYSVLTSISSI